MIDRSLLSRLPPSDLIRLAGLNPHEAVTHLRVAARLCLDGARCVAFRDPEQERLARRLIADGIALYTLALQRFLSPPPRPIRQPKPRLAANDSASQGQPWEKSSSQDVIKGMHCAQHWLEQLEPAPLWEQFSRARQDYAAAGDQHAFETGFLFRLQEQLLAATKAGMTNQETTLS